MRYYLDLYRVQRSVHTPIRFWFESDQPHDIPMAGFRNISLSYKDIAIENPSRNTSVLVAFHRMVMADGVVMSYSSLSFAAALLNNVTNNNFNRLVVPSAHIESGRRAWIAGNRFTKYP